MKSTRARHGVRKAVSGDSKCQLTSSRLCPQHGSKVQTIVSCQHLGVLSRAPVDDKILEADCVENNSCVGRGGGGEPQLFLSVVRRWWWCQIFSLLPSQRRTPALVAKLGEKLLRVLTC